MAIKTLSKGYGQGEHCRLECLCDNEADAADLPICACGSIAVIIETGNVYVVNSSGEWVKFGGEK